MTIQYVTCNLFSCLDSGFVNCKMRAIPEICAPLPPLNVEWTDVPDVDLLRVTEALPRPATQVGILVGNDLLGTLVQGVRIAGEHRQRLLIWDTLLGIALSGIGNCNNNKNEAILDSQVAVTNDELS